jgi:hypothetical protein
VGCDDISEKHAASVHPTQFSPEDRGSMFRIIVANAAHFIRYALNKTCEHKLIKSFTHASPICISSVGITITPQVAVFKTLNFFPQTLFTNTYFIYFSQ